MKKYACLLLFSIAFSVLHAQTNNSNNTLIRHDTTVLKAGDCEWIIKSMARNDPALNGEIGKPLSLFFLDAIEKGQLKAFDAITNKPIPAKKIFTWNLAADSIMTLNDKGNPRVNVIQRKHSSDKIDEIEISHDWYLDVATGKLQSVIKWIELREQVNSPIGDFLGYRALCRIYY